jgi:hypothetical protein
MRVTWQKLWEMTDAELIAFGEKFDARMAAGEMTVDEAKAAFEAWDEYKSRRSQARRDLRSEVSQKVSQEGATNAD